VLVLQRLEPTKDTATALRAWAASGLGERGWTLEVVGGGSEEASLSSLASRLGIAGSCRFVGVSENVDAHLGRASMLLATSPEEPFGLSVLEAMGAGLAVVASGSAGHLETVGLCPTAALFPPGDSDRAARLLRELATDELRRVNYGRSLQGLARERFTIDREVNQILDCYRSIGQPKAG
jgi:glycosyltransferase involved in cell wall biosynthesis